VAHAATDFPSQAMTQIERAGALPVVFVPARHAALTAYQVRWGRNSVEVRAPQLGNVAQSGLVAYMTGVHSPANLASRDIASGAGPIPPPRWVLIFRLFHFGKTYF
jgi:hypothetical protein